MTQPNAMTNGSDTDAAAPLNAGINPLVSVANPLLNAIPHIRHSATHDSPDTLRGQLIDEVRRFEVRCQQARLPYEVIIGARYCLCTALDEAASLTPWGSRNVWPRSGLLVTFHNETWGGEKFFQLLAKLSQNPQEHIYLLELINVCLLLGFEGRYRILENGRSQLETMKQRLLQVIRTVRGGYAPPLSGQPTDEPVQQKLWRPLIPVWAWAALMALIGCLFYIGLNLRLGQFTSPVLSAIYQINLPQIDIPHPAKPLETPLDLRRFLSKEIAQGLVTVRDESDKSVVILRGDGLFDSASTNVHLQYLPVIERIAQAMDNVSGQILITGYTDNVPIKSHRFSSNYELSLARAQSVQQLLGGNLNNPSRIRAEGRGENDPLAPNTTADNRARNRRVEITLMVAPKQTQTELNSLR
ncbi:DotU family type VI secretion system protein [Rouxiella sp. S1S-2]|uniref:DotU family type VI secretion system protein n=1 Tax=Rouxiella sp. S1S-2 TaxID=2653856 RepID=UPI001D02C619|nr:DotU family type VI secretion system protein [Rouxiella sp. S1S-2]